MNIKLEEKIRQELCIKYEHLQNGSISPLKFGWDDMIESFIDGAKWRERQDDFVNAVNKCKFTKNNICQIFPELNISCNGFCTENKGVCKFYKDDNVY